MKIKKQHNRDDKLKQKIAQEKLILDVTEAVFEQLEIQGKTKTDLATGMGRSNAYISQLLNGSRNMTLRTLSDLAHALNIEPHFEIGYRDQLCHEPSWDTILEPNVKLKRNLLCYKFGDDERSLSGEWVDACIEKRSRAA